MMASIGACPDGLFECQIFASCVVKKGTHWRVAIRPVEDDAADDLHARLESNRIGRVPRSRVHGAQNVIFGSDQANVDRIARNVLGSARYHRAPPAPPLMLRVAPAPAAPR